MPTKLSPPQKKSKVPFFHPPVTILQASILPAKGRCCISALCSIHLCRFYHHRQSILKIGPFSASRRRRVDADAKKINSKMRQNQPAAGRTTPRTPNMHSIRPHDHRQRLSHLLWPTCGSSGAGREHAASTPPFRNLQTATFTPHRS